MDKRSRNPRTGFPGILLDILGRRFGGSSAGGPKTASAGFEGELGGLEDMFGGDSSAGFLPELATLLGIKPGIDNSEALAKLTKERLYAGFMAEVDLDATKSVLEKALEEHQGCHVEYRKQVDELTRDTQRRIDVSQREAREQERSARALDQRNVRLNAFIGEIVMAIRDGRTLTVDDLNKGKSRVNNPGYNGDTYLPAAEATASGESAPELAAVGDNR